MSDFDYLTIVHERFGGKLAAGAHHPDSGQACALSDCQATFMAEMLERIRRHLMEVIKRPERYSYQAVSAARQWLNMEGEEPWCCMACCEAGFAQPGHFACTPCSGGHDPQTHGEYSR